MPSLSEDVAKTVMNRIQELDSEVDQIRALVAFLRAQETSTGSSYLPALLPDWVSPPPKPRMMSTTEELTSENNEDAPSAPSSRPSRTKQPVDWGRRLADNLCVLGETGYFPDGCTASELRDHLRDMGWPTTARQPINVVTAALAALEREAAPMPSPIEKYEADGRTRYRWQGKGRRTGEDVS